MIYATVIAESQSECKDLRPFLCVSAPIARFEKHLSCVAIEGDEEGFGGASYIFCRLALGPRFLICQLHRHPNSPHTEVRCEFPFSDAAALHQAILDALNIHENEISWSVIPRWAEDGQE